MIMPMMIIYGIIHKQDRQTCWDCKLTYITKYIALYNFKIVIGHYNLHF